MKILIENGNIITPSRIINNASLVLKDNKIYKIIEDSEEVPNDIDSIVSAEGNYISPGFIEIHTHGGGGYDFMDGTIEAIDKATKAHMKYGTTSIIPTTLTSTMDNLFETLDTFKKAKENCTDGPNILGLHLEGPYFSHEQKGAQDPRYIREPNKEEYLKILDYSDEIIRWSIAPELDGAIEMGNELKKRNVLASIAHSNAVYEEVVRAFDSGFTHITHLYSGMSMVRRINAFRYSGVVESAYLIDEMTVEIIADGKHLPASLLKLIYKIKGPDKICLVTDSMRGAGMPEGKSILGGKENGQEVIIEDGVAKLMDRTAFAGSVATADRLVRTMIDLAEVPLKDAIKMITLTPARILNIDDHKGVISEGKDADIVIFDNDIDIKKVFVNGDLLINNN